MFRLAELILSTADQCSPTPCFNGGTCGYIDEWPYFECECPLSYLSYNCGSQSGTMVIDVIRGWDDVEGGDEHNASFSKGPIARHRGCVSYET